MDRSFLTLGGVLDWVVLLGVDGIHAGVCNCSFR